MCTGKKCVNGNHQSCTSIKGCNEHENESDSSVVLCEKLIDELITPSENSVYIVWCLVIQWHICWGVDLFCLTFNFALVYSLSSLNLLCSFVNYAFFARFACQFLLFILFFRKWIKGFGRQDVQYNLSVFSPPVSVSGWWIYSMNSHKKNKQSIISVRCVWKIGDLQEIKYTEVKWWRQWSMRFHPFL